MAVVINGNGNIAGLDTKGFHDSALTHTQILATDTHDSVAVQAQFDSAFPAAFDTRFASQDTHDSALVQAQIDATIASTDTHDSVAVQGQFDSAFPSAFDTRFALQDTHDSVAVQAQIDSAAVLLTGNQSISGVKTFTDSVIADSTGFTLVNGGQFKIGGSHQNTDIVGGSTDGTSDNGALGIFGGRHWNQGAGITLYGDDHPSKSNQINFTNNAYVTRMLMDSDGHFGIGTTTTDSARLKVFDKVIFERDGTGTEPYINLELMNTGSSAGLTLDCRHDSGRKFEIQSAPVQGFIIYDRTANSYRFNIDHDGNVGINTTAPTSHLSVNGSINEKQYNFTGTAIDPDNGTVQYVTLTGNVTYTSSLANGEYVTLMIDDGSAYTVTWPTITWVGGSAPTLETTGYNVIELWQVNGTLYGAFVGVA